MMRGGRPEGSPKSFLPSSRMEQDERIRQLAEEFADLMKNNPLPESLIAQELNKMKATGAVHTSAAAYTAFSVFACFFIVLAADVETVRVQSVSRDEFLEDKCNKLLMEVKALKKLMSEAGIPIPEEEVEKLKKVELGLWARLWARLFQPNSTSPSAVDSLHKK